MSAKPRQEVAGGIFHVTPRGNAREVIFLDELDYMEFLRALATAVAQARWLCHSYCLLPNHYHLLLETPEPTLATGMRCLNGRFAQRFNRRYDRVGHVFQGPYGAELVQTDAHLRETCRYIALNPVRAGLCEDPAEWPWSSYAALAGLEEGPSFLTLDFVRGLVRRCRRLSEVRRRRSRTAATWSRPGRCEGAVYCELDQYGVERINNPNRVRGV
jgi:REP element-mobilizing transposase RayT